MTGFIYIIKNTINNKYYIGKTRLTIQERFEEHKKDCFKRDKEQRPLYTAMRKYGVNHFYIELLEEVNLNDLSNREQYWINYYNTYKNGYNATLGGDGSLLFDYEKIVNLYNQGLNAKEISNEIGCSVDTVSIALKNANVDTHKNSYNALKKKVKMYNNKEEKIFNSQMEASQWLLDNNYATGKKDNINANIGRVVRGLRNSAYGFKWEKV